MESVHESLQTLELSQNASLEEIKESYHDLVMVWHPDRFLHNPRLRQKAEDKLKQFNQAYEDVKAWLNCQVSQPPQPPSPQTQTASPPPNSSSRRSRKVSKEESPSSSYCSPYGSGRNFRILLGEAEFILQHYDFECLNERNTTGRYYQGGPFALMVYDNPLEMLLSVPCDSLQTFDRILLSIPCKSTGHFIEQEAERLLELLQRQG